MISAAVEGLLDEAVVNRLILQVGGQPGSVYAKNGKPKLRDSINGYNNAAKHSPWIILIDLDQDEDCAPSLRDAWLPDPAPLLCFRIAVRQVESWLMGDAETLANYLGVSRGQIPANPEALRNSKEAMVNLARHSRHRSIRADMVPRESSGRSVGPAYTSRMMDYASTRWRPASAAARCESLQRALNCLTRLVSLDVDQTL